MKKLSMLLYGLIFIISVSACDEKASENTSMLTMMLAAGGGPAEATFDSANRPGDFVNVTADDVSFNMIYANDLTSITFPTGWNDTGTATLTRKFFMGETEVTNALFAEVLQWARDNGKIVEVSGAQNQVSATTVKYGNQELIDLDYGIDYMKISYNTTTNRFSVASGYENHPVVAVSWYGAVVFCNWLTEMIDGSATNLVYTWVDNGDDGGTASDGIWQHGETYENPSRTGYRLPSSEEWEFAARYIGTRVPTVENLASEYVAQNRNGGSPSLTAGYYWTPGDYANGAIKDYTNAAETGAVA